MPKDQWAIDRSREIGQKAVSSGEFERPLKPTKKKPKKKKKKPKIKKSGLRWRGNQVAQDICDRAYSKLKNKKKSMARTEKATFAASHMCSSCKIPADVQRIKECAGGITHVGLYCGKCGKWIKWLPHDQVDMNQV